METITTSPVIIWVAERFYVVFIAFIIVNLLQRKRGSRSARKRIATLYLAVAAFLVMIAAQTVIGYELEDWIFVAALVVVLYGVYHFRNQVFPFRLRSPVDGRRYTLEEILFVDDPDSAHDPADRSTDVPKSDDE